MGRKDETACLSENGHVVYQIKENLLKVVMLHIELKGFEHTITCKQICCPYIPSTPGWDLNVKTCLSSKSGHVAYQMNRKVGHAHTIVI